MLEVNDVIRKLNSIKIEIKSIVKEVDYFEGEGFSELKFDSENPNDIFLEKSLMRIFCDLEKAQNKIEYLEQPIKYESKLFKNEIGRYETEQGDYYTCGSGIEYLSNDKRYSDYPFWRRSSVESNGGKYYIVDEPKLELSGLLVRKREV